MKLKRYQAAFILLWSLERIWDAVSTRRLIELGAVERNALLRKIIAHIGLDAGLALWSAATIVLGILLGALLPAGLSWGLRRARRLTSVEKALLDAYGVDGVSKIILVTSLVIGGVAPLLNSLCLLKLSLVGG